MFDNTVKLVRSGTPEAASLIETKLMEFSGGKTVRRAVDGTKTLTISHQASNENPGFSTRRTVVRNEQSFDVADTEKQVKPYVQVIISAPTGGEVTLAQVAELLTGIVSFLRYGDNASPTVVFDANPDGILSRLLTGEP